MRSNYAALGDLVSQLEEDVAALEKRPMVVVAHALLVNAVADIDSYARVAGHTYRYDEEAYNAHILRYIRIKLFSELWSTYGQAALEDLSTKRNGPLDWTLAIEEDDASDGEQGAAEEEVDHDRANDRDDLLDFIDYDEDSANDGGDTADSTEEDAEKDDAYKLVTTVVHE
jgi:hypothetical protein